MNTILVEITYGQETHVNLKHLDPIEKLMLGRDGMIDKEQLAQVEMQALVSAQFSNARVVSTVRLNCYQSEEVITAAQGMAIELVMHGLHEGWMTLRERVEKGAFPGAAT